MDKELKIYIDNLSIHLIPWNRMLTAYGTAEKYEQALSVLEETLDVEQAEEAWNMMSDFEHQSTMFPPAPFALIFLVRILQKLVDSNSDSAREIAKKLIDQFIYYVEVCNDADDMEHADALDYLEDMLDEEYLLPEDLDEDELEEYFEDEDAIPEEIFYSSYYYSKQILSQVTDILDECGKFSDENERLKMMV